MKEILLKIKENEDKRNELYCEISKIKQILSYERYFSFNTNFYERLRSYLKSIQEEIKTLQRIERTYRKELVAKCSHTYITTDHLNNHVCLICERYFNENDLSFPHTFLKGRTIDFLTRDITDFIINDTEFESTLKQRINSSSDTTIRLIRRNYD